MEDKKLIENGPNVNYEDDAVADELFAAADEYDEIQKALDEINAEEEENGDLNYTRASMNDLWVEDWDTEPVEYCDAPVDDTFGLDFDDLEESVDLKKISYNRALELADDNDKPVIYGYTVKGGEFKDVAPVVCDDIRKCTIDFQEAHPDYNVVYVAYPGGMQIDESVEAEEIDFDKCLEAFNDFDDDVECCECHDMFHKGDCEKGEHGYVCKHCREVSEYYDREATADPESTVEPSKDVPVKDCPVNDVITHCEEETPDCEMKKPALEKPLTEDTDEIKLWSAEEVQRAIDEIL